MKRIGLLIVAAAFVFSSGFLKKNADGTFSADTAALEKKANELAAQASEKGGQVAKDAMEKMKKAAAKYTVNEDEIMGDLSKGADAIKQKVAAMDPAKLIAYLSKYKDVLKGSMQNVTETNQQVSELNWMQKFSKKGKELKAQTSKYKEQFNGLKEQAKIYVEKLESYGISFADLGIDLSAYGL